MRDAKEQLRLEVLREWFDQAGRANHPVPLDSEVMEVARSGKLGDLPLSATMESWAPTIGWLLKQLRFGLVAPIEQLPSELSSPKPRAQDLDAPSSSRRDGMPTLVQTPGPTTHAPNVSGPVFSSDPKHDLRRSVLRAWAANAKADGHSVPTDADIDGIAQSTALGRDPRSDLVEAWRATIEWLLRQLLFGVAEPEHQVPTELRIPRPLPDSFREPHLPNRPATPDSSDAAEIPAAQSALAALRAWRDTAVARDEPSISQLKDSHLKQVANSQSRTAAEIKGAFGPIVGRFSEQLAAVLLVTESNNPNHPPDSSSQVRAPEPLAHSVSDTDHHDPGRSAPTRASDTAGATTAAGEVLDWNGFALYDFGPAREVPSGVRITRTAEGAVRVAWDPTDAPASYRLVSSDNHAPMSPDSAQRIAATRETNALDSREFVHAIRHFQVWRNDGVNPDDARHNQPELHALGAMVAPVLDVDVREDEGRTIGQWRVLDGTHRVQVFRIPIRNAVGASGDPMYRILPEAPNLGGFVDSHPVRGEHYLYQVFAEALIDGISQLSAPVGIEMKVSIVHEPVLDLSFDLHDDLESPLFDLSWTNPAGGRVVVYRTKEAPTAGIERAAQLESVLEQAGLTPSSRLAHPIAQLGERSGMVDVPWPRDWTRAYFTAVVLQDGQAYVGNTVRGVRVPPVARPKLTERVNRQVLTFEWPSGADAVQVFRGPTGMDAALAIQGEAIEISESDYREKGGLSFSDGKLGASDCDLHIVSVAFDGGKRVNANPVTINFQPILRLQYAVAIKRTLSGKQYALVSIASEIGLEHPPPFVLVHNANRLPLTASDGTALAVERDLDTPGEPARRFVPGALTPDSLNQTGWRTHQASWNNDIAKPSGFLRLFVALPPERLHQVALLDPPVSSLRLRSRVEQAQGVFGG